MAGPPPQPASLPETFPEDGEERTFAGGTVDRGLFSYSLATVRDRRWRRFQAGQTIFETNIWYHRERSEPFRLIMECRDIIEEVLSRVVARVRYMLGERTSDYLLQLIFLHDDLDSPVMSDMLLSDDDFAIELIMSRLSAVLISKKTLRLDRSFRIHANWIDARPATVGADTPSLRCLDQAALRHVMPAFRLTRPDLKDCCLLITLAMGMARIDFLEERTIRRSVKEKHLFYRIRRQRARLNLNDASNRALESSVDELCSRANIDPREFSNLSLDETLEKKIDLLSSKLKININLRRGRNNFKLFCSAPSAYASGWPSIEMLLLEDGSSENGYHCCLIHQPLSFFKERRRRECNFCRRGYDPRHLRRHVCPDMRRRGYELCPHCLRRRPFVGDYFNRETENETCREDKDGSVLVTCARCSAVCNGGECISLHRRICRDRGAPCQKCGRLTGRNSADHNCDKPFRCHNCQTYYGVGDEHICQMSRPARPQYVPKMVFWDTETVTLPGGRHRVNAVGASFETSHGVFEEIFFYDSDMNHPRDYGTSLPDKKQYQHDYLSDVPGGNEAAGASFPCPPASLHRRLQTTTDRPGPKKKARRRPKILSAKWIDDECEEVDGFDSDDDVSEQGFEVDGRDDGDEENEEDIYYDSPDSAVKKFLLYFLDSARFYGYTFVAHYSAKFDTPLILRALLRLNLAVEPVMEGNKVLMLRLRHYQIRFIDSFRYIGIALEKFPARFPHLQVETGDKGSFPYLFNEPSNYGYVGEVPGEEYFFDEFSPPSKISKAREYIAEFRKSGKEWNFNEILHQYLRQDVALLRAGVTALIQEFMRFQKELVPIENRPQLFFHPFSSPFFTGSAFVHALWRYYAMPNNTFYLLKNQRNARKTSRRERDWVLFLAETRPSLQSAFTHEEGQKKIGPYFVDGYDPVTRTVFEFLGCKVHGHVAEYQSCPLSQNLNPEDFNPFGLSLSAAYARWTKKKQFIESQGLSLEIMWECQHEFLTQNPSPLADFERRRLSSAIEPTERLKIRQALRGGRTECFTLFYDQSCKQKSAETELLYVDKNSLYPHVAIAGQYPAGRPRTYVGATIANVSISHRGFFRRADQVRLHGLIQCSVLPPNSLFLPVLPTFVRGKLMYGLCRACLEEGGYRNEKGGLEVFCGHTAQERMLQDVWTTIEMEEALASGYSLMAVHELMLYDRCEAVFSNFYLGLARMKLESEGFPPSVKTAQGRADHVEQLNSAMPGLLLQEDRVERNDARRNFAKFVRKH